MNDFELWHNPRCSKSRLANDLLTEAGVHHRVRRYLEDPPSPELLDQVLLALGQEPWDFARGDEAGAAGVDLEDWSRDRQRWIEGMVAHPILIERPVLTTLSGERAVVARPPRLAVDLALQEKARSEWPCFDATRWFSAELWAMKL